MKKILVIPFLIILSLFLVSRTLPKQEVYYPALTGYVMDDAGVLSAKVKIQLENELREFDPKAQIAVVTIKTTQPLTIDEYSINLATQWGIGDKDDDNGILFIVATEDRKVRIEVGYGLEGVIPDAKAGRILDNNVIPYLKTNDWENGIVSGVNALKQEIN